MQCKSVIGFLLSLQLEDKKKWNPKSKRLAPVYDNGNCFNCKWDDDKMKQVMLQTRLDKVFMPAYQEIIAERKGVGNVH